MKYEDLAREYGLSLSEEEFVKLQSLACPCPKKDITDNERKIYKLVSSDVVSVSISTVMDILVDNASCETKCAIGENISTSDEVLRKLLKDKCHTVRQSLIFNKKISKDILLELMNDEDEVIAFYARELCERRSRKNIKKEES